MPTIAKIIWTVGFLIGTTTHLIDIWMGGWLPYEFRPIGFNIYWTSLVFLDPLAVVLIWARERWGVVLGVAVMASDVLVNGYTAFVAGHTEFYTSLALQSVFAAFVFFTAWEHWRKDNGMQDRKANE